MDEGARLASRLRAAVEEGVTLFEGVSEERTARRPAPREWCAREVIGHLIDSACNNQRRFVINQDADRLTVDPYDQETWVARQHYATTPASVLVPTWAAYNTHVARLIEHIPDAVLTRGRGAIADYRFVYLDYPPSDVATLRDLIEDYVGHIRHHFKQIRRLLRAG
jgi:hypothetical protein